MVKHILTIIKNQRKNYLWILIELLVVFICLWYIVDYTGTYLYIRRQPVGFNIEHTYKLTLNEYTSDNAQYISSENKHTTIGEDLLNLQKNIRLHPDIEAVSISKYSQPYAATQYTNKRKFSQIHLNDSSVFMQRYEISPSFFRVFRISAQAGSIEKLEKNLSPQTIILSQEGEKRLIPGSSGIGKWVNIDKDALSRQITAICSPIRNTEYFKAEPCFYILLQDEHIASELNSNNLGEMELCIRVKPEKDNAEFPSCFLNDLTWQTNIGNLYVIDVLPTSVIRKTIISPMTSKFRPRLLMLFFLLVNIFLGISGVFWHRTQHRHEELGIRMAFGANRNNLHILLIGEGVLLLTIITIPATIMCFNICLAELIDTYWMDFTAVRFLTSIFVTYLLMAIMIISGIWYPAHLAMRLKLVEVLSYE